MNLRYITILVTTAFCAGFSIAFVWLGISHTPTPIPGPILIVVGVFGFVINFLLFYWTNEAEEKNEY